MSKTSDLDLKLTVENPICAACGSPYTEHQPGGTRFGPTTLCGVFIPQTKQAPLMENPYIKAGQDFVLGILDGGKRQIPAPGAADRLRQFAYYMTEQQKAAGDALLVSDLWDAVKAMERITAQSSR